jgi:CheY-like chemotaxis protein
MAGPRILIVEDDAALREILSEILLEEGYRVECAANGADALALLQEIGAPDLILLDLMMPVMSGWELRTQLRADPRLADVPVLVLSGRGGASPGAAPEADAFLGKPFDAARLLATVGRLV